jgi:multiple sugar transport system permease protein
MTLFPFYWMINTAFKSKGGALAIPPQWIPENPTLENFKEVITGTGMAQGGLRYAMNSLVIATASMVIALLLGTLAAYGLARWESKWSDRISMWILSTRMFPPSVTVIPVFLMFVRLGLVDTHLGLIIAYVTYNLPFVTWMMRGFFTEIPAELEDAARVDGCSNLGVLFRVSLPLVRSGLAVAGLFAFVFSWNEFLFALVLTRIRASTIPIQMASYQGVKGLIWESMMACAVITSLPGVVLAFLAQKHLVKGLSMGAVKG